MRLTGSCIRSSKSDDIIFVHFCSAFSLTLRMVWTECQTNQPCIIASPLLSDPLSPSSLPNAPPHVSETLYGLRDLCTIRTISLQARIKACNRTIGTRPVVRLSTWAPVPFCPVSILSSEPRPFSKSPSVLFETSNRKRNFRKSSACPAWSQIQ